MQFLSSLILGSLALSSPLTDPRLSTDNFKNRVFSVKDVADDQEVRGVQDEQEIRVADEQETFMKAGVAPSPNQVYIKSITYGGTGCPAGSVANSFSADRTIFTMIFDNFVASAGPGIPPTENRKNCQINLVLNYPGGWSYSIASVDYRGFASLPPGVTATQKANYYFSGMQEQVSSQSVFRGPYDDGKSHIETLTAFQDYIASDQIPIQSVIWAPCGQNANGNINTQVRLTGDLSRNSIITVDSVDGKVKQIYKFQWRRC